MPPTTVDEDVATFLEAAERVLGLRLCFHPRPYRRHWPERWITHADPACLAVRRHHQSRCAEHCDFTVFSACGDGEGVTVLTCPFGHTELLCPLAGPGGPIGMLYAGPLWTGDGHAPREGMVTAPDGAWLADRIRMLPALARRLAELVAGAADRLSARRRRILAWCHYHLHDAPRLAELAAALELSPSRTGHVVKECFGMGFPALVHDCKLREAAHLLRASTLPLADIALRFGYHDQAHFTRRFRQRFGVTPGRYRRKN